MKTERPILNGKTDRENLHILESWAQNLMDELEYTLNHIDETILAKPEGYVRQEQMQESLDRQYKELRSLIVSRTKGA